MYHYVEKVTDDKDELVFDIEAGTNSSNVFAVINDNLYLGSIINVGVNKFKVVFSFKQYDLFEAYVILPFIQPDKFQFGDKFNFISKALARVKRLEHGIYEKTASGSEYSLFKNYFQVFDGALTGEDIIVVSKGTFIPDHNIYHESESIYQHIAGEIIEDRIVPVADINNGDFYILSKHSRNFLNLINLASGMVTASKVIQEKVVSDTNYDVYEYQADKDTKFNRYDYCGVSVKYYPDADGLHIPHVTQKYMNRSYYINEMGSFSKTKPVAPSTKHTFSFNTLTNNYTADFNDINIPAGDEGVLIYSQQQSNNYTLFHGYIDSKTTQISENPTVANGPLPDLVMPVKSTPTAKYYGIRIMSDNLSLTEFYPVVPALNYISYDSLWERTEITGGVTYVTKVNLFTYVQDPIKISWRIYHA